MRGAEAGIRFRLAVPEDAPALVELLAQLFAQEAEFTVDPDAQRRGLDVILGHPEVGSILVSTHGAEVVAMVSLLYVPSTALGGRAAWLEDLIVRADARGQGLGDALLKAAIAHARGAGCLRITLLTDADNERAQRLYARHGFSPSPMRPFRLSLSAK